MIVFCAVLGVLSLAVGGAFYWLNLNSPIQTCIPALALPVGAVLLLIALGGWAL
jgi:hypothetical protein